MKYVIWGAGYRGKKLIKILGCNRIIAFIDSNPKKIGELLDGIPVISFDTYKEKYKEYFIIISIVDYKDVEKHLQSAGVYNYFILGECPSELQGYGINQIDRLLDVPCDINKENIIIGSNLYSVLLYDKLMKMGCQKISCYPNEERNVAFLRDLKEKMGVNIINGIPNHDVKLYDTTKNKRGKKQIEGKGNQVIESYDFMFKIPEYYNSKILQFKNKHKGKRCFIIATGPSLRKSDLDLLLSHKELCFGVNRIFNMHETKWKPDYYMALDDKFILEYEDQIKSYDVENKFIEMNFHNIEARSIYPIHVVTNSIFDDLPEFSEKMEWGVYGATTVTYGCIQMAVYMGFKEIYLLGVDCNYLANSKNNYFFEESKEDNMNHQEDKMVMAYRAAKEYADRHGIKIYNATRGGMLEVFERVKFDSLFEET